MCEEIKEMDNIIEAQDEVILKLRNKVIQLHKLVQQEPTSQPPDDIPSPLIV